MLSSSSKGRLLAVVSDAGRLFAKGLVGHKHSQGPFRFSVPRLLDCFDLLSAGNLGFTKSLLVE